MIYAGCSGYSFRGWVGSFYPPRTRPTEFLSIYSSRLNSVEINHTFRRFPKIELVDSWSQATPKEFRFSFKMHQSVTHRARLRDVDQSVRDFMHALTPLGNRLGVVLFQLPPFLRCELERLDALLGSLPPGHRYAIEFRHESWRVEAVERRLKDAGVALCAAELEIDAAAFPPLTAPFGYVRLRKTPPYSKTEIETARSLVNRLSGEVEDVYLYVKHDDEGRAPQDVTRIAT